MNKAQKEIELAKLAEERRQLNTLKAIYKKAAEDVNKSLKITNGKIEVMLSEIDDLDDDTKSVLRSQIYHKNFQEGISRQLNGFLNDLNSKQYKSIDEYLNACYETGFVGAAYELADQGIPLIMPIDQKKVVKAVKLNSKIKKELYTKLGEDVDVLKKRIANNISRGIAFSDSYENIARNIRNDTKISSNNAMRIARTEGHRVHIESSFDAMKEAQSKGADIVKQWNAQLDGKTRPRHRKLDGQIRELDEPFEIDGMEVMYPSAFGRPEEDINCRCVIHQRSKWNLDEDELEVLKQRASFHGLRVNDSKAFGQEKAKDFADFKKKYLNATEKTREFNEITAGRIFDDKFVIEIDKGVLYNNSPAQEAYDRAIMSGELTPLVNLELYVAVSTQIDKEIVGLTTANGIEVKSKSDHFISRTIGSVEQRRNGVAIKDIIRALTEPDRIDPVQVRANGKTQRFILKGVCAVTINPDTGNLIQVNPLR